MTRVEELNRIYLLIGNIEYYYNTDDGKEIIKFLISCYKNMNYCSVLEYFYNKKLWFYYDYFHDFDIANFETIAKSICEERKIFIPYTYEYMTGVSYKEGNSMLFHEKIIETALNKYRE